MKFNFRKPNLGNQINRSHPLAKGLVGCWLMNEGKGTPYNLCDRKSATGGLWVPDAYNNTSAARFSATHQSWMNVSSYTIAIFHKGMVFQSWGGVVCKQKIDSTNSFFSTQQYSGAGYLTIYHNGNNAPDSLILANTTTAKLSTTGMWALTFAGNNKLISSYINGVFVESGTHPNNLVATTAGLLFLGRERSDNSTYRVDYACRAFYMWNRALSAAEIAQLYREPFCIFERPCIGRFYAPPAGGLSIPIAMRYYRNRRIA